MNRSMDFYSKPSKHTIYPMYSKQQRGGWHTSQRSIAKMQRTTDNALNNFLIGLGHVAGAAWKGMYDVKRKT